MQKMVSTGFIQVWCDMTTDSGGFILFGYQNSSVTWNVPSTNEPVEPLGSPRWSSVLGNAPILDIRVQISSSKEFKDTKADWSFRLNTVRPLKKLMLMGEKGCDQNSPGIGDIAYVKDLKTEKIVTRNFRCSKFGIAYHVGTKFGWESMNSCLQKPCSQGFAFLRDLPIQIDYYGAFSYSVNRPVSGTSYNATAFIGCDQGKCCACYGPIAGTKDYCTEKCQAINGGTLSKNVYVWFWLRSTLPKRVWRKCMEFQSPGENGQLESYKLIAGDPTPVKGHCIKQEVLLNEGIVVVPNVAVLNKVPGVQGLLTFRKDINRLYLRSGSSWRRVADESEVSLRDLQLQRRIEQLESNTTPQLDLRITTLESNVTTQLEDRIVQLEISTTPQLERRIVQLENRTPQLDRRITQLESSTTPQLERRITTLESNTAPQMERRITTLESNTTPQLERRIRQLESSTTPQLERRITTLESSITQQLARRIKQLESSTTPQLERRIRQLESSTTAQLARIIRQLENTTATQLARRIKQLESSTTPRLERRIRQLESSTTPRLARKITEIESSTQQLQREMRQIREQYPIIRLSGGGTSTRGRVEVYKQPHGWGTVCDDSWEIDDGHVVCRQLGFSRATAVYQSAHYGQGSGKIWLDDLECTGKEPYLWDCPHGGWSVSNCGHGEDASVDCE